MVHTFFDCFGNEISFTKRDIVEVCQCSERTASRWLREGFPYWALKMMELYTTGRVIPEGWRVKCCYRDDVFKSDFNDFNHISLQQSAWFISAFFDSNRDLHRVTHKLDELEALARRGKVTDIQEARKRVERRIKINENPPEFFPPVKNS